MQIKKTIMLFLCVMSSMSLVSQELPLESIKTIDSLHEIIGQKRIEILSLATEGRIDPSLFGPNYDPSYKGLFSTVDLSVFIGEVEFTVNLSEQGKRGQVTVTANGENSLPFVCYIMYSRFDGIGCPMELDMGKIKITKDPRQYDRESDSCNRNAMRINTLEEVSDLEMYSKYLQNNVIPILDNVIRGSKK